MTDDSNERALLTLLADAKAHSSREIKKHLAMTTAELEGLISALAAKGLAVERDGQSYRLAGPVSLLSEARIRSAMAPEVNDCVSGIELLWQARSTNTRLLEKAAPPADQLLVCLAEFQSAGRGRLQRTWRAPLCGGICMSVSCTLTSVDEDVATMGLVAGLAVRSALESCGVQGVQLKWPNDLVVVGRKIGGLLLEARNEAGGASASGTKLVIGVGLNYRLDELARADIVKLGGIEPVDIHEASGGGATGRNALVASVLSELLPALRRFSRDGFAPFVNKWRAVDACRDAPVSVITPSEQLTGVARGIDGRGALQLDVDGEIKTIVSAQVSLRPA